MPKVLGNGYEAFGRIRGNGETEKTLVHNIGTVSACQNLEVALHSMSVREKGL